MIIRTLRNSPGCILPTIHHCLLRRALTEFVYLGFFYVTLLRPAPSPLLPPPNLFTSWLNSFLCRSPSWKERWKKSPVLSRPSTAAAGANVSETRGREDNGLYGSKYKRAALLLLVIRAWLRTCSMESAGRLLFSALLVFGGDGGCWRGRRRAGALNRSLIRLIRGALVYKRAFSTVGAV